jgi:hypothetical protein
MTNPYIHAALARERQKTFLAKAEAYRRARQTRSRRQRVGTLGAPRRRSAGSPAGCGPAGAACSVPGRGPR